MQFSELGEMGLFTEQSVAGRSLILHPQYIYHLDQCVCTYHSDLFVEIPKFSLSQENQIVIQFVLTTDRREKQLYHLHYSTEVHFLDDIQTHHAF